MHIDGVIQLVEHKILHKTLFVTRFIIIVSSSHLRPY